MVWLASVGGVVISEGRSPAYTGQGRTDRVLQLTATHWPAEGRHAARLQGYSGCKVELETNVRKDFTIKEKAPRRITGTLTYLFPYLSLPLLTFPYLSLAGAFSVNIKLRTP